MPPEATPSVNQELIDKLTQGGKPSGISPEAILAQLTALAGQVASLTAAKTQTEAELASLKAYKETTGKLFRTDTKPEDAKAATAFALKEQGWSEQQIAAHIAEVFAEETPAANPKSDAATGKTPVVNAEIEALRKQVAQLVNDQQFSATKNKETYFQDKIGLSVKENPKVKEILAAGKRLNGEKWDEAKTIEAITNTIRSSAYNALVPVARGKNGQLELSDIDKAVEAATEGSTGLLRQVIGEPNLLGRTPETVAAEQGFSSLESLNTPVPERDLSKFTNSADKEQAFKEDTNKEFLRLATKMAVAETSQV